MGMWLVLDGGREVLGISLLLLLWRGRRWRKNRRRGDPKSRLNLLYAGRALVNSLPSSRAFFCKMALLFAHIAKQIWTALYLRKIYSRKEVVFMGVLKIDSILTAYKLNDLKRSFLPNVQTCCKACISSLQSGCLGVGHASHAPRPNICCKD